MPASGAGVCHFLLYSPPLPPAAFFFFFFFHRQQEEAIDEGGHISVPLIF